MDREFIKLINGAKASFIRNGQKEYANKLNSLIVFLENQLKILEDKIGKSTIVKQENYFNFLGQVLQINQSSNCNREVVYSFLQNNLNRLDETFAETLYQWAIANLSPLESEEAYREAAVIGNFSNLINDFPLGNKANNLEIAIKGYQALILVFNREAFPNDWAMTQTKLGTTYWERIKGEKAENLESAIACYRKALKVRTPESFPNEWAIIQTFLGNTTWKVSKLEEI